MLKLFELFKLLQFTRDKSSNSYYQVSSIVHIFALSSSIAAANRNIQTRNLVHLEDLILQSLPPGFTLSLSLLRRRPNNLVPVTRPIFAVVLSAAHFRRKYRPRESARRSVK